MSKENTELLNDLLDCVPVESESEVINELAYIDSIERELSLQFSAAKHINTTLVKLEGEQKAIALEAYADQF